MKSLNIISLNKSFAKLKFINNRKPTSTEEDLKEAFCALSPYRDGAIYIGHYAGSSEWERHPKGEEIVYVVEGETTLVMFGEKEDSSIRLKQGELFVVPQNVWHRFETPVGVKILSVTPEPGDHRIDRPCD